MILDNLANKSINKKGLFPIFFKVFTKYSKKATIKKRGYISDRHTLFPLFTLSKYYKPNAVTKSSNCLSVIPSGSEPAKRALK